MTSPAEWRGVRKDTDGRWLCSATGCIQPATAQVAVPVPTEDDPAATAPLMACNDHQAALT